MNLFERASRNKLRFNSSHGELTVEQLWDINLSAATDFSLDKIAQNVNADLISVTENSFVETKPNPRKRELKLQLDILKHVIEVKQNQIKANLEATATAQRRSKLIEALAVKDDALLGEKSRDELLEELKALA